LWVRNSLKAPSAIESRGTAAGFNRGLTEFSESFIEFSKPFTEFTEPFTEFSKPFTEFTEPFTELSKPFTEFTEPFTELSKSFTEFTEPFIEFSKSFTELSKPFTEFTEPFTELSKSFTEFNKRRSAYATPNLHIGGLIMPSKRDYIPQNDGEFDLFFKFMNQYVADKCSGATLAWTHIPNQVRLNLADLYDAWYAAYMKMSGPHTPVDTETKNNAKKAAKAGIRALVNQYLRFPPVTNEDRSAMGIPNHDTVITRVGKPKTLVMITGLRPLGGCRVEIRFRDETTPDSHAIPYGMNGGLFNFAYGPEPLTDVTKLRDTILMTRSPFRLELPPEARGQWLSCTARWQSKAGLKGPWGEISHTLVD
jgi:hypothetical protein